MGQSQINNEFMSSSSVKKRSQIHLQQQNWTLLEKPDVDREQMGSFGIYKNQVTGEVAREYSLNLENKKALKSYVDQFDYWRSQIRYNVLESKYIVFEEQSFGLSQLCSKYYPVKIYVQNPVVTLAEIKDIPVPQGLYIILSSLIGFQHLFQVFGYFALTQSMITINEHGIVKVWIHPNLSSNRPLPIGLHEISQTDIDYPNRFIRELIEIIDNNIDYGDIDVKFGSYINKKYKKSKRLDFPNCRKHLLNFAQQLQIDLPDSLLTILDLLFDKTNRTSISEQDLSQHNGPTLYGKNYENKYLLGQDSENLDDKRFNILQNVQSPSQNSQFPHRSPSDQIGSFYPQDMQMPLIRNSPQQLSVPSQNSNQRNLPRNYSYNEPNSMVYDDPNLVYLNPNHRRSYPTQIFTPQENYVTQNQNVEDFIENPYNSLVQRQNLEKQSTIRQEIEQDSFLTSYKNGKFQSSKDLKRASNNLKKHAKNIQSHRNTNNSHSDCKLNIQNLENLQPYQTKMKQQQTKNINLTKSQLSMTKKSQKSIQFHTLYEVKQLDAEIAQDLQKMLSGISK